MDGDGVIAHYAAAQTDITERVEQQNMLKQIEKMESLGSLAGGIAHDFNNMLLPIIALTKMTLKKLPDQSEHRHRLEKVIQAATRARDLVAQILKFSRREELKQENLNINEILDETLGLLRTTLPSTVKITEIRELETGCIFADASQIGSVLLNLASNAADAMDGKPGELEFSLSRQVVGEAYTDAFKDAKPGPYARIQVRDTGYGMDEPTLKRIFEPFFTTKAVGKGTGLGLATAYGIITKHGGMIHVASEVGKGTTFNIYLPLIEDTDAARTAGPKAKIKSGAKRKNNLVSSY
jgi:signal transduction histidine kinase